MMAESEDVQAGRKTLIFFQQVGILVSRCENCRRRTHAERELIYKASNPCAKMMEGERACSTSCSSPSWSKRLSKCLFKYTPDGTKTDEKWVCTIMPCRHDIEFHVKQQLSIVKSKRRVKRSATRLFRKE